MPYSTSTSRNRRCLVRLVPALFLLASILPAKAQELRRYGAHITLPGGKSISGICIIRTDKDGGAMSLFNEFGIKAFDAVYSAGKDKVELRNVIKPLNRWRARRIIAKDMKCLFDPGKKTPKSRTIRHRDDGTLVLSNKRFKITYHLTPLKDVVE